MHQVTMGTVPDDSPVAQLYQRHARSVQTYLHRFVSSKEDVDDLLLEVFLAAMENPAVLSLREERQLAWLRRVARNKAIDHGRSAAHRRSTSLDEALHIFDDARLEPEQVALRHEDEALLRRRIATLPALQQQVLRLRFEKNLLTKEIAQKLGKSDSAIRMALSRALNLLRSIYHSQEGASDEETR